MKQVGYGPSQAVRGSQPGDAYLYRATEAFGMRRPGRQGRFLAGVICATVGLGLCSEGVAMAVAPRHPVVGQVLFFVAIVAPFTIFLTVLMVPRLGFLREITVAIRGLRLIQNPPLRDLARRPDLRIRELSILVGNSFE
jgi:hypothetical protein